MRDTLFAVVLVVAGVVAPAVAHHGAATFDTGKEITLKGVVTEWIWANPHCFLKFDAKDETGAVVRWACESGAPGALSRRGFKRNLLKLGDTLIVDGYRAKNGANLMDARRVTLSDGQILSGASAGDGGPQ